MTAKTPEQLVSVYGDMVYRLAYAQTRSRHDADDIFQEVFLQTVRKRPVFDSEEHEKAWLIRVNINVCKNFLRFHSLHPMVDYEKLTMKYHTEEENGLMDELFQLSQKSKEVLILHYVEGYTNAEIGKILRISESAVKKRMERARKELRKRYNRHLED